MPRRRGRKRSKLTGTGLAAPKIIGCAIPIEYWVRNIKIGKAGRNRRKGIRPSVRGVVMNAADHPHGGGDGGRHGMGKDPRTPWGQKTLGYKTRTRKTTTKFIVKTRHQAKRK